MRSLWMLTLADLSLEAVMKLSLSGDIWRSVIAESNSWIWMFSTISPVWKRYQYYADLQIRELHELPKNIIP